MHTWLRGPLKYRDAPLPFVSSLRDFDSELIHAVCHEGVYQYSPLGAFLVFPACWLAFFSEPNCVGSGLRQNKVFCTLEAHCSPFLVSLPYIYFLVHLSCFTSFKSFYKAPDLVSPAVAFPISTTGSTQETSTDCGDMTLTLMSWATYSGGSETTSTDITAQIQRGKSFWLQTNIQI